jgi:hypothetical protein
MVRPFLQRHTFVHLTAILIPYFCLAIMWDSALVEIDRHKMVLVFSCRWSDSNWILLFASSFTCYWELYFMNPKPGLKRVVDIIGISLLALFLYLSLAFRASPVSLMNPGFPILSSRDWMPEVPSISIDWHEYPQRFISEEKFSEVAYVSQFSLDDASQMFPNPYTPTRKEATAFSGFQTVIRYSGSDNARSALRNNYAEYSGKLKSHQILITEIPGLNFSSQADEYYIWCQQISADDKTTFDPVDVDICYYWAVYGRYYSEIRFFMWPFRGSGRQFSVSLFNDVLNRADSKLANTER